MLAYCASGIRFESIQLWNASYNKQGSAVHSLSFSSSHHLNMTEILQQGTKLIINSFLLFTVHSFITCVDGIKNATADR